MRSRDHMITWWKKTLRCFLHPPKLTNPNDEVIDYDTVFRDMDSEGYDVIDAEYTEDDKTWQYKLENGVNDLRVCLTWGLLGTFSWNYKKTRLEFSTHGYAWSIVRQSWLWRSMSNKVGVEGLQRNYRKWHIYIMLLAGKCVQAKH